MWQGAMDIFGDGGWTDKHSQSGDPWGTHCGRRHCFTPSYWTLFPPSCLGSSLQPQCFFFFSSSSHCSLLSSALAASAPPDFSQLSFYPLHSLHLLCFVASRDPSPFTFSDPGGGHVGCHVGLLQQPKLPYQNRENLLDVFTYPDITLF